MDEASEIVVEARDGTGKGAARAARRAGMVPGVVYGDKKPSAAISLSRRTLERELNSGAFFSTLYELKLDDRRQKVLPRDVQRHPVTDVPLHVDFLRLAADARVTIEVPVQFINEEESEGLKRGGVLNVVRYDIEVSCRADTIPERIEVDLAGTDIGDSIHISAVKLPDGVEPTITDRDFTIATVAAPTVQEEETPAEGEEGAEDATAEVAGEEAAAETDGDESTDQATTLLLFVGLGNPGAEHARNRHNFGYMVVEEIIRRHKFSAERKRFQGLICEGRLDGERVMTLKPTTYMNESGRSVGEAARFYKLTSDEIVVFHDEVDLAAGKIRVKRGGGSAGHNGIRSLDRHIGNDYRRVRLGVGHPGNKHKVAKYTLSDFAKSDAEWVEDLIDAVADAAPLLAAGDDPGFATKVALLRRLPPPKPPEKPAADQDRRP